MTLTFQILSNNLWFINYYQIPVLQKIAIMVNINTYNAQTTHITTHTNPKNTASGVLAVHTEH